MRKYRDPDFSKITEENYRGKNFQENARGYGRQNSRGEYRNDRCDG